MANQPPSPEVQVSQRADEDDEAFLARVAREKQEREDAAYALQLQAEYNSYDTPASPSFEPPSPTTRGPPSSPCYDPPSSPPGVPRRRKREDDEDDDHARKLASKFLADYYDNHEAPVPPGDKAPPLSPNGSRRRKSEDLMSRRPEKRQKVSSGEDDPSGSRTPGGSWILPNHPEEPLMQPSLESEPLDLVSPNVLPKGLEESGHGPIASPSTSPPLQPVAVSPRASTPMESNEGAPIDPELIELDLRTESEALVGDEKALLGLEDDLADDLEDDELMEIETEAVAQNLGPDPSLVPWRYQLLLPKEKLERMRKVDPALLWPEEKEQLEDLLESAVGSKQGTETSTINPNRPDGLAQESADPQPTPGSRNDISSSIVEQAIEQMRREHPGQWNPEERTVLGAADARAAARQRQSGKAIAMPGCLTPWRHVDADEDRLELLRRTPQWMRDNKWIMSDGERAFLDGGYVSWVRETGGEWPPECLTPWRHAMNWLERFALMRCAHPARLSETEREALRDEDARRGSRTRMTSWGPPRSLPYASPPEPLDSTELSRELHEDKPAPEPPRTPRLGFRELGDLQEELDNPVDPRVMQSIRRPSTPYVPTRQEYLDEIAESFLPAARNIKDRMVAAPPGPPRPSGLRSGSPRVRLQLYEQNIVSANITLGLAGAAMGGSSIYKTDQSVSTDRVVCADGTVFTDRTLDTDSTISKRIHEKKRGAGLPKTPPLAAARTFPKVESVIRRGPDKGNYRGLSGGTEPASGSIAKDAISKLHSRPATPLSPLTRAAPARKKTSIDKEQFSRILMILKNWRLRPSDDEDIPTVEEQAQRIQTVLNNRKLRPSDDEDSEEQMQAIQMILNNWKGRPSDDEDSPTVEHLEDVARKDKTPPKVYDDVVHHALPMPGDESFRLYRKVEQLPETEDEISEKVVEEETSQVENEPSQEDVENETHNATLDIELADSPTSHTTQPPSPFVYYSPFVYGLSDSESSESPPAS
ncbi:hypothetical protein CONLIGDRAFT_634107 [Coniochaeta ligniaria NRRL 30616]|uniref:Uncharacterized protein n=1 Tax=Coniochaeta ligniaria NRRL 30616 TaxID=1408157 RepID=A0A1J7JES9_9PEZI|nr:hypothetical protein CONLIGDRAFT_634107 [Coniochaeta ligniaria NRRL 30616]